MNVPLPLPRDKHSQFLCCLAPLAKQLPQQNYQELYKHLTIKKKNNVEGGTKRKRKKKRGKKEKGNKENCMLTTILV